MVISMSGLRETEKEELMALERQNRGKMMVMIPVCAFDGEEIIKLAIETAGVAVAFGQLLLGWLELRRKQKEDQNDKNDSDNAATKIKIKIKKTDGEIWELDAEQITQEALNLLAEMVGGKAVVK